MFVGLMLKSPYYTYVWIIVVNKNKNGNILYIHIQFNCSHVACNATIHSSIYKLFIQDKSKLKHLYWLGSCKAMKWLSQTSLKVPSYICDDKFIYQLVGLNSFLTFRSIETMENAIIPCEAIVLKTLLNVNVFWSPFLYFGWDSPYQFIHSLQYNE
jgi:hypothetical protein